MPATTTTSGLDLTAQIVCPLLWSVAYVLMIKRGLQDKSFGMPVVALAGNIAFEVIFSFFYPELNFGFRLGNMLWLLPDLGILYTCLRFGAEDFTHPLVKRWFRWFVLLLIPAALLVEWAFITAYQDHYGKALGSFTNLLTAALLIGMYFKRNSVAGQSFYIALCLLIGNAFGYRLALYYPTPPPPTPALIIHGAFSCLLLLNAFYAALIYRHCRLVGLNPWGRF